MDSYSFNDTEGLRIAVEIEKRGENMYREALKVAKDPEVRALLAQMADEEAQHARRFETLLEEALEREADEGGFYSPDISAYLSTIAAAVVFPDGVTAQMANRSLDTVRDVLATAISAEKDSILFYMELALRTRDNKSMSTFFLIVDEEKRHLLSLQKRLNDTAN